MGHQVVTTNKSRSVEPVNPPHVIRLHAVWKVEPLVDSADGLAADGSALDSSDPRNVPHRLGCRFSRRFGLPTGLEPDDRVELVIRLCELEGQAWLNGQIVGPVGLQSASFPVTEKLQLRNVIVVETLPSDGCSPQVSRGTGDFPGEVRLEIT